MKTMQTLRRRARLVAKLRGHDMTPFKASDYWGALHQNSHCRKCPAQMTVILRPAPNEAHIMGDAVAVGCPVPDELHYTRGIGSGATHVRIKEDTP